jgi:hypothetical protein
MTVAALDAVVWGRVASVLTTPKVIAQGLRAVQQDDPTANDLESIDRARTAVERQQRNLVDQLALVEGDVAALVREKLAALTQQRAQLEQERAAVERRRAIWAEAQARLTELEAWCRTVAANLPTLNYAERRTALVALGIQARLYRADHTPRYEIRASIPLGASFVDGTSCPSSAGRA